MSNIMTTSSMVVHEKQCNALGRSADNMEANHVVIVPICSVCATNQKCCDRESINNDLSTQGQPVHLNTIDSTDDGIETFPSCFNDNHQSSEDDDSDTENIGNAVDGKSDLKHELLTSLSVVKNYDLRRIKGYVSADSVSGILEPIKADQMLHANGEVIVCNNILNTHNDEADKLDLVLRLQDFHRARKLRRKKHGKEQPYGVHGLFLCISSIRTDLEWTDEAAWRRSQGKPFLSWIDFDFLHSKSDAFPYFTIFMIVASTISLIVGFWLNDWHIASLNVNPMIGPTPETLLQMGALETTHVIINNQIWRLITPAILHAGFIHWIVNVVALWLICGAVEKTHGTILTSLIFVVCVVGGNLLSVLFSPHTISVGASGGIFGVFGVCLADVVINWELLFIREEDGTRAFSFCSFFFLITELLVSVIIGLTPYIDNFAHLGGLFYGSCLGSFILKYANSWNFFHEKVPTSWRHRNIRRCSWNICRVMTFMVAISLFCFTFTVLMIMDNPISLCPRCRFISCVPFPFWSSEKLWYCDGCDFVEASLITYSTGSLGTPAVLELTCPLEGNIATIQLKEAQPDREDLRHNLKSYCRAYC